MATCPLSKNRFNQSLLVEAYATASSFTLLQAVAAKVAELPLRAPFYLGLAIPLSHYLISFLEHQTYPDGIVQNQKHQRERQLIITTLTFLIIRSYKQTPQEIPYRWGFLTLGVAYIGANLY